MFVTHKRNSRNALKREKTKCRKIMGGHGMIGKLGLSTPYTKMETGANVPTTGAFLSLAVLEKCMPSVMKKDAAK